MPDEVTIEPTLGHALLVTQGGVGADPGYDAVDMRRLFEAGGGIGEGTYSLEGWKVRENPGAPDMSVTVAADLGVARVEGDAVVHQGPYIVAPHADPIELTAAPAHGSDPRVDLVVLQIRDDTHDGSGEFDARAMYLTGTPTDGATLDDPDGAPALPDSALALAHVLVPADDTTITNVQIRDLRESAVDTGTFLPTPPLVTELPGSPGDGDECYFLADEDSGTVWHLRYREGSLGVYKWEYVGGPALQVTPSAYGSSAIWADLSTYSDGKGISTTTAAPPMFITAPLDGDYDVTWGAQVDLAPDARGYLGVARGAAAPDSAWEIRVEDHYTYPPSAQGNAMVLDCSRQRVAELVAGDVVQIKVKGQTQPRFHWRYLQLRPRRVG